MWLASIAVQRWIKTGRSCASRALDQPGPESPPAHHRQLACVYFSATRLASSCSGTSATWIPGRHDRLLVAASYQTSEILQFTATRSDGTPPTLDLGMEQE